MGTEEPASATPLVFVLGNWLALLTRAHDDAPVVLPPPAVTANGMVSPVEATLSVYEPGAVPPVPVTKLKFSLPPGASLVTLNVEGGLRTERVTRTLTGLFAVGIVSTTTMPE